MSLWYFFAKGWVLCFLRVFRQMVCGTWMLPQEILQCTETSVLSLELKYLSFWFFFFFLSVKTSVTLSRRHLLSRLQFVSRDATITCVKCRSVTELPSQNCSVIQKRLMPTGDFTHSRHRHPSTNRTSTLFSSSSKGHTILWHWVVLAEIGRCGHKKNPIPRLLLLMQKASTTRNWRTWVALWSELPPCFFALLSSTISNNLYTLPSTTKNRHSHSAPISSIYSEGYSSHFEPFSI